MILRAGLLGHLGEDGGEIGRDGEQRSVAQAEVIALMDVVAVKVGIAGRVGELLQ